MLAASLGSEFVHGSYLNAAMPVHAWLCVIFGLAYHQLRRLGARLGDATGEMALTAVCVAQFALLAYPPWALAPTRLNLKLSNDLVQISRGRSGAIEQADAVQVFANAPMRYAEGDAVGDLMLGGSESVRRSFVRSARRRICQATPARPVIVDEDALDPQFGIVGPDEQLRCDVRPPDGATAAGMR